LVFNDFDELEVTLLLLNVCTINFWVKLKKLHVTEEPVTTWHKVNVYVQFRVCMCLGMWLYVLSLCIIILRNYLLVSWLQLAI